MHFTIKTFDAQGWHNFTYAKTEADAVRCAKSLVGKNGVKVAKVVNKVGRTVHTAR